VKVSVLIPAYNEAASVRGTVERVRDVLDDASIEHEIIVIDDGSTDGTAEAAWMPGVRVLEHPVNAGYGRALKTGLREATSDWIAITDADGSYPIEMLPTLIREVPDFDMVVGARTGRTYRGSMAKWWGRKILETMVHFVTAIWVPDVNSGMRVFRRSIAVENIRRIGNGFSFTTTLTLAMLLESHFVRYIPIEYHPRVGKTKVKMGRDMLRTLQILVMAIIVYNPIKLFLFLAYTALMGLLPCIALDVAIAGGYHVGVIVALLGGAALGLFGMGLVTDVLRRATSDQGHAAAARDASRRTVRSRTADEAAWSQAPSASGNAEVGSPR
jgi:glycosyltransferase involved in cell wall biosynthesis